MQIERYDDEKWYALAFEKNKKKIKSHNEGYSLKKRKLKQWIYENNMTQPYVARKLGLSKAELQRKLNNKLKFNEQQLRCLVYLVGAERAIDIIYFPTMRVKKMIIEKTFGINKGDKHE